VNDAVGAQRISPQSRYDPNLRMQKVLEALNIRVVDSQIEGENVKDQQSDRVIFIVEETDESISTSATSQEVNSLPWDGKSNQDNQELEIRQQTDTNCSICLLGYYCGDHVAWSKKPACQHTFHRDCLVPWLLKHDECPNCRCNYF